MNPHDSVLGAPTSEESLDDLLTTPSQESIEALRAIDGDLMILGAGGKLGPSLAVLAQRSVDVSGGSSRIVCVSRFTEQSRMEELRAAGIRAIACDLLDREELRGLPDIPNLVYLAGHKFGTSTAPDATWGLNCYLPAIVAERFAGARMVALSTGNVYPLVSPSSGGATEDTEPEPVGEYAQSCLGRERVLAFMSRSNELKVVLVRLNYATDLRYGVLLDIAQRVAQGVPIDLGGVAWFNTIWQRDANVATLRSFQLCSSPPDVINLTGPETLSVREVAWQLASILDAPEPRFTGSEGATALLSNAARAHRLFGEPSIDAETLINWTGVWVRAGLPTLGKPTHYDVSDGRF